MLLLCFKSADNTAEIADQRNTKLLYRARAALLQQSTAAVFDIF